MELDITSLDAIEILNTSEKKILIYNKLYPNWGKVNNLTSLIIMILKEYKNVQKTIEVLTKIGVKDPKAKIDDLFVQLENSKFIPDKEKIEYDRKKGLKERIQLQSVYLNVTSKCNMACSYCCMDANGGELIKEIKDMTFEKIVKIVDKINSYNPNIDITLIGGEPFLRDDLLEILKYLENLGINTMIVTNGTLLNENLVSKLPKGLNIKVSIDSINPDVNDCLRGNTKIVLNNIDTLIKYGFKPRVGVTLSRKNKDDIEDIIKYCNKREIVPSFAMLEPFGRGCRLNEIILSDKEVIKSFEDINNFYVEYLESREKLNFCKHILYKRNSINHYCGMGKDVISVASNGDVYSCINLHVKDFLMGNMLDDEIPEILSEQKLDEILIPVEEIEKCKDCTYKYLCAGGCRAKAYWTTSNGLTEKNNCDALKYFIMKDLDSLI